MRQLIAHEVILSRVQRLLLTIGSERNCVADRDASLTAAPHGPGDSRADDSRDRRRHAQQGRGAGQNRDGRSADGSQSHAFERTASSLQQTRVLARQRGPGHGSDDGSRDSPGAGGGQRHSQRSA